MTSPPFTCGTGEGDGDGEKGQSVVVVSARDLASDLGGGGP